ncbi:MAG: glycosyltransferase family 4 protein [Abitibacteriaceae bacterium]|nr:glycosyltransferase family 4 protein [Abditibacteriaceae bacterium]
MRILHIANHVKNCGNGIVNVLIDLACLQARAGHQVGVVSSGGEYISLLADYSVQHFTCSLSKFPLHVLSAWGRYQFIIETFQPDVVHVHMVPGLLLSWVFKRYYGYSLVATVHNEFQRSARLMGLADLVIAVSQAVANSMRWRGIPEKRLCVVRNGVIGSPRTRPLTEFLAWPLQRPALLTVAGMYERKGILELIAAFTQIAPQFPSLHLYLVGDGPCRTKFEHSAGHTAVAERIHFEGFQAEPQRYFLGADIFVLASRREPFGLALVEAREAGCAIIGTRVDGIPEALDGGEAGLLVPPCNASALADVLQRLLSHPALLQEWRDRASRNLSWLKVERCHEETLAVYRRACEGSV